jgi:hypothetical protein
MNLKIAIAQINSLVGDLAGNAEKIFQAASGLQPMARIFLLLQSSVLRAIHLKIYCCGRDFTGNANKNF